MVKQMLLQNVFPNINIPDNGGIVHRIIQSLSSVCLPVCLYAYNSDSCRRIRMRFSGGQTTEREKLIKFRVTYKGEGSQDVA